MKNEIKKFELFPEGVEKLENSDLLLIKGGNKPPTKSTNVGCFNLVCW